MIDETGAWSCIVNANHQRTVCEKRKSRDVMIYQGFLQERDADRLA